MHRRGRKKGQKDKVDGIMYEGTTISSDPNAPAPEIHASPVRAVKSRRKAMAVSQSQFDDNWDRIFGK